MGSVPVWEWTYDALNMQQRYQQNFPDWSFQEYIYLYGPGDLRLMEFDGQTGIRKMIYRNLDGSLLREYEVSLRADKASGSTSRATPGRSGRTRKTSSTARWASSPPALASPIGGGARFFFADHLGSPRVLTNGLGTLTGKHHYFPSGKECGPGQEEEQQYKYTGHQRDPMGCRTTCAIAPALSSAV